MLVCDGSAVSESDWLAERTCRGRNRLTLLRDTAGRCRCGLDSATVLGELALGCADWLCNGKVTERRSQSCTPRNSPTTMAAATATYAPTSKNRLSRIAIGVKRGAIHQIGR